MHYLVVAGVVVLSALLVVVPPIVARVLANSCRSRFTLDMLGVFFLVCAFVLWIYFIGTLFEESGADVGVLFAAIGMSWGTTVVSDTNVNEAE